MKYIIELCDESIIANYNKDQVYSLIDQLVKKERKCIVFKGNKIVFLRLEPDSLGRIHIYRRSLNKMKQTVQPISKTVCKKLVSDFLDGDRNWFRGLSFTDMEPYEPPLEIEKINKFETDDELEERERKTLVIALASLLVGVILAIYMYSIHDQMSTMNFRVYSLISLGSIGGIVLFIYMIFDFVEIRNKRKSK